ncbi:hypothetical protein ACFO0D_17920 [Deinococcus hohokamensis]|uniref:Pentapeptide repeat-containing protein n=2 Tax=Deinococcus hohokamensis TaxID=309883 RepID=A0ABV9IEU3_9DEIO
MNTKAEPMLRLLGVALSLSTAFTLMAHPAPPVSHVSVNGLSVNGLAFNGLSVNGLAVNGLSVNGLTAKGSVSRPAGALDLVSLGQHPLKKK